MVASKWDMIEALPIIRVKLKYGLLIEDGVFEPGTEFQARRLSQDQLLIAYSCAGELKETEVGAEHFVEV